MWVYRGYEIVLGLGHAHTNTPLTCPPVIHMSDTRIHDSNA